MGGEKWKKKRKSNDEGWRNKRKVIIERLGREEIKEEKRRSGELNEVEEDKRKEKIVKVWEKRENREGGNGRKGIGKD